MVAGDGSGRLPALALRPTIFILTSDGLQLQAGLGVREEFCVAIGT